MAMECIMLAREIMSKEVACVKKGSTVRDVARILLEKSISAVPIVDEDDRPIGMVSEGDIAAASELRRNERAQWWLAQLAEGESLDSKFLATIQLNKRDVGGIMRSPVISVDENTEVEAIARIMEEKKIKRVVILREGKMVGIVSRADIVRAVATKRVQAQITEKGRVLASD
jgi:CBS domain-containing protein